MSEATQGRGEQLHGATAAAVTLSADQRQQLAAALDIDVRFVPEQLAVLGIPRANRRVGIALDRAGQFAPALVVM